MPLCGYLSLVSFLVFGCGFPNPLLRERWRDRVWLVLDTRQAQILHRSPLHLETGNRGADSELHLTEPSLYFSGPPFLHLERNDGSFPRSRVKE